MIKGIVRLRGWKSTDCHEEQTSGLASIFSLNMPFTPIHIGPEIFIKAHLQGSFSLMVFGWTQVIMDIQPVRSPPARAEPFLSVSRCNKPDLNYAASALFACGLTSRRYARGRAAHNFAAGRMRNCLRACSAECAGRHEKNCMICYRYILLVVFWIYRC